MLFRPFFTLILLSACSALPVSSAYALSCAQPDIVRSFKQWSASPKQYVLARGTLSPAQAIPEAPKAVDINNPLDPPSVAYRFDGAFITASGSRPRTGSVQVDPYCLAAWCGGYIQDSAERIMAFEIRKGSYVLPVGPCPGESFLGDLEEVEASLQACLNGNCPPEGPIRGE